MTIQVNQKDLNYLLQNTAQLNEVQYEKAMKQYPEQLMEIVENERERRFELIMDVPPEQVQLHSRNKTWPWS